MKEVVAEAEQKEAIKKLSIEKKLAAAKKGAGKKRY